MLFSSKPLHSEFSTTWTAPNWCPQRFVLLHQPGLCNGSWERVPAAEPSQSPASEPPPALSSHCHTDMKSNAFTKWHFRISNMSRRLNSSLVWSLANLRFPNRPELLVKINNKGSNFQHWRLSPGPYSECAALPTKLSCMGKTCKLVQDPNLPQPPCRLSYVANHTTEQGNP